VLDFLRGDEYTGIVTEYADGGDLEDYVNQNHRGKGLPAAEAREIALRLVAALSELHSNEIVHRDLKPGTSFRRKVSRRLRTSGFRRICLEW
jgi:serine/threonine protein kinase